MTGAGCSSCHSKAGEVDGVSKGGRTGAVRLRGEGDTGELSSGVMTMGYPGE